MTWLITSDLHLTDRPRDAYRFGLFPWLAKEQARHNVTATFILGDLTDQKDKHSATLVNRLVDEMIGLRPPVFLLKGNHDFIDPANPFFKFLSCVEGIEFVTQPTLIPEQNVALIPHQPDQAAFDAACTIILEESWGVMCHATFEGAIAETGAHLAGLQASLVAAKRPLGLWAGDVHKPQRCGPVTYVGSPYHVRFGDDYTPRVLLVKGGKEQNLYFPAPHKWALTVRGEDEILNNEDLRRGDQVRLTVELAREEAVEWSAHKQRVLAACKEVGLEVYGCELKVNSSKRRDRTTLKAAKSPEEVLAAFCQAENVATGVKKVGMELICGQTGGS